MRCDKVIEELSALLDGELSAADAVEIRAHLDACPACRREFEALQRTVQSVQSLTPVAAPEDFNDRVMARVDAATPPSSRVSPWRVWWPAAAAVLIGCLIALFFPDNGRRVPSKSERGVTSGELSDPYQIAKADTSEGKLQRGEAREGMKEGAATIGAAPENDKGADMGLERTRRFVKSAKTDANGRTVAGEVLDGSSIAAKQADATGKDQTLAKAAYDLTDGQLAAASALRPNVAPNRATITQSPSGVDIVIRSEDPKASIERARALIAKRGWSSPSDNRQQFAKTLQTANQFTPNAQTIALSLSNAELAMLTEDFQRAGLIAPMAAVGGETTQAVARAKGKAEAEPLSLPATPSEGPAAGASQATRALGGPARPLADTWRREDAAVQNAEAVLCVTIVFLPMQANVPAAEAEKAAPAK